MWGFPILRDRCGPGVPSGAVGMVADGVTARTAASRRALVQYGGGGGRCGMLLGTEVTMRTFIRFAVPCIFILLGCRAGDPCDGGRRGKAMESAPCVMTDDCCYDYEAAMLDRTSVLTCSRYARACRPGTDLPLGESCEDSVQCASRNCEFNYRYCTVGCQNDAACDSETACTHPYLYDGGWFCRPMCLTDDDCVVYAAASSYGDGLTCKRTKSRGGFTVSVCSR